MWLFKCIQGSCVSIDKAVEIDEPNYMFFQCRNCGGNVVYSPEKHGMFCPFCGSEKSHQRSDAGSGKLTLCPNCGGEVPVEKHTSATQCPYCDSYLVFNERVEGVYAPKMIIPFQLGKDVCKKSIREKFKNSIFAPSDFLSEVRLNSLQGIYVPYWFYDYDTNCYFQGEGTRVRSWRSGNMEYTETSFYAIRREMDIDFRKIPVDASEQMPDDVMDLMAPFRYDQLMAFSPEYMSGFYGEKYNMDAAAVENRANVVMKADAAKLLRESYAGYHAVSPIKQDVVVRRSNAEYGLLPVWKYIYHYKDKDYPFYVNGQTGKIVGTAPVSAAKVWGYTATLWGCMTIILLLLSALLGSF